MFDRFTDRARKVMGYARQASDRLKHDHIGTEHILLGLVEEGSGVAVEVLKNLDIDPERVRMEVEKRVKCGPEAGTIGQMPFTKRARKVLDYAVEEARGMGHKYIGTEHLLLGLLREKEGKAVEILTSLGVQIEDVRCEVLKLLGSEPGAQKTSLKEMAQEVGHWHAEAEGAGDSYLAARLRYLLDYLRERTGEEGGSSDSPG